MPEPNPNTNLTPILIPNHPSDGTATTNPDAQPYSNPKPDSDPGLVAAFYPTTNYHVTSIFFRLG